MGRRPRFRDQTLGGILARLIWVLWVEYTGRSAQSARARPASTVRAQPAPGALAGAEIEQPVGRELASPARRSRALPVALGGLAVLVVLSLVVLAQVFSTPGDSTVLPIPSTPVPAASSILTAAPTEVPLVAAGTGTLTATVVLGGSATEAMLSHPQEALSDGRGHIYVADTNNHRVAVLDLQGHLLRSITRGPDGPLQAPYSLALTGQGHILLLDSDAGRVIEYDGQGTIGRASSKALSLVHARGIGLDAKGDVLVADPASSSILTLNADLTPLHVQPGKAANGGVLFLQPAAVAGASDGSIYVVDGEGNRLLNFTSGWSLRRSWPLPASDTEHSPRPLPLTDGQVVLSDPTGGRLLIYSPAADQPHAFALASQQGPAQRPLGLAPLKLPEVLVTCSDNGQIWEVPLPLS